MVFCGAELLIHALPLMLLQFQQIKKVRIVKLN